MNKKDREALDKFVDEDSLSPEDTKRFAEMTDGERATFIAERFFEAGAKHGRAELKEENKKLRDALKLSVDSASFFSKFADCTKDSWACRCEFCRDTKQTKSLATARQVLKDIGEE